MTPVAWSGEVEGVLRTDDSEMLRDLMAVVEAAQEKSVRLTKSGIPPKPLWSSINSRLLWRDPKSILQDWDEADQVRFIYGVAEELHLLQADVERTVTVGPGADRFFTATPSRRAAMIMRAYINVQEWDERCDARNEHGHRLHFGQTFRRDFAIEPPEVRRVVIRSMGRFEADKWYTAASFARVVTKAEPALLISADDDLPEVEAGEADAEIQRFVDYWLYQAARFGWIDLARTPELCMESGSERLFQLSELGQRLLGTGNLLRDDEDEYVNAKPFTFGTQGRVTYDRTIGDAGDEYLIRRLADSERMPSWDSDVVTYYLSAESLDVAVEHGVAVDLVAGRLLGRLSAAPNASTKALVDAAFPSEADATIVQGLTAVELDTDEALSDEICAALAAVGAIVGERFVLVPWDRWDEFRRVVGFEPGEGFRYPTSEPLARVRRDLVHLEWPVLPLAARDLLVALGVRGDPLQAPLSAGFIESLGAGWSLRAAAETLQSLAHDDLPAWLAGELG